MKKTAEQTYNDLFGQLADPLGGASDRLAATFRAVEDLHSSGQITEWQLQNARAAYARTTGSRVGDAAHRVIDQARDRLQAAAEQVRDRTGTAVVTYTQRDPARAVLIAAAVGAVAMAVVSMMARSGVRTVRRKLRR